MIRCSFCAYCDNCDLNDTDEGCVFRGETKEVIAFAKEFGISVTDAINLIKFCTTDVEFNAKKG